jgi:predicted RNA methylase
MNTTTTTTHSTAATLADVLSQLRSTYSPEDNKLRLYSAEWLPDEVYARIAAVGFRRAPMQGCYFAPMWTPERADVLMDLCDDIGDEDTSLVERAEVRAERFTGYQDKRAAEAERAKDHAESLADMTNGQPIIVGHHSPRRAEKQAQKIEAAMTKAVNLWDTSEYWKQRAKGALRHAKYKELPRVRANRIKGLEADKRRHEKDKKRSETLSSLWGKLPNTSWLKRRDGTPITEHECALFIANRDRISHSFTLAEYPREAPVSQYEGPKSLWSALSDGIITWAQAVAIAIPHHQGVIAYSDRWIAHIDNRLTYERLMLAAQGASELIAPRPRPKQLPLCNYRAPEGLRVPAYYKRELEHVRQVEMTQAEYAAIGTDYKGTRVVDHSHRVRVAILPRGHERVCVFLTDAKTHERPAAAEPPEPPPPRPLATERSAAPAPKRTEFDDMRASLRHGVRAVSAPQLFATPASLGDRMVEELRPVLVDGARVLEPEGGTGALLRALALGCPETVLDITTVEHSCSLASDLARRFPHVKVREADFLEVTPEQIGTFDAIIMNPPFADGADVAHVTHALSFLRPNGRLRAVMSAGVAFRTDRPTRDFRALVERRGGTIEPLPPGTFEQSGTGTLTVLVSL